MNFKRWKISIQFDMELHFWITGNPVNSLAAKLSVNTGIFVKYKEIKRIWFARSRKNDSCDHVETQSETFFIDTTLNMFLLQLRRNLWDWLICPLLKYRHKRTCDPRDASWYTDFALEVTNYYTIQSVLARASVICKNDPIRPSTENKMIFQDTSHIILQHSIKWLKPNYDHIIPSRW